MVSLVKELLLKWQVLLDCLLLKEKKIREANTKGTGELIKDALDRHCQKIYLGIGGSATNDGGIGMAHHLGIRF